MSSLYKGTGRRRECVKNPDTFTNMSVKKSDSCSKMNRSVVLKNEGADRHCAISTPSNLMLMLGRLNIRRANSNTDPSSKVQSSTHTSQTLRSVNGSVWSGLAATVGLWISGTTRRTEKRHHKCTLTRQAPSSIRVCRSLPTLGVLRLPGLHHPAYTNHRILK